MGTWTRAELEETFASYLAAAAHGGATGDWERFGAHFTEDCVYLEHLVGEMHGRDAVLAFYRRSMVDDYPGNCIVEFPVEWHVVDEERGWILFQAWSVMADPGDGSVHRAYNFSLVKYAGDGRFHYQEDIYNPMTFAAMIGEWEAVRAQHGVEPPGGATE